MSSQLVATIIATMQLSFQMLFCLKNKFLHLGLVSKSCSRHKMCRAVTTITISTGINFLKRLVASGSNFGIQRLHFAGCAAQLIPECNLALSFKKISPQNCIATFLKIDPAIIHVPTKSWLLISEIKITSGANPKQP